MELAWDAGKWNEQVSVLSVTSYTEFLPEGYEARTIQYLLKPVEEKEVEKVLTGDHG